MHMRRVFGRERRAVRIEGEMKSEMEAKITVVTRRMKTEERHSQQRGRFERKINVEICKLQESKRRGIHG